MKKATLGMLIISLAIAFCTPQAIDVEAEKAAIREVIQVGFDAYYSKNFDEWSSIIVQSPNTHIYWANKSGSYEQIGWDKIFQSYKRWMERNPEPDPREHVFENFNYRIWKDAALVTFDYHTKAYKEKDPDFIPIKCIHMFEKTSEGWKYTSWVNLNRNTWKETE